MPGKRSAGPDLSNLEACLADLRAALADRAAGPGTGRDPRRLRRLLVASRRRLPGAYRRAVLEPLLAHLDALGPRGVGRLLRSPDDRQRAACLLDLVDAVRQARGAPATRALQEVVSDLYDGFLAAEARDGVRAQAHATLPPLVKWGHPELGPYTWPVTWTRVLGARAGVVGFPPAARRRGLLLWAALSHETAGHDLLAATPGLEAELSRLVRGALGPRRAGGYWAERIGEAASDVLGILNMGPVVALAIQLHLRGLRANAGGPDRLRGRGPARQRAHPGEAARAYLGAAVVRKLRFPGAAAWAAALEREVDGDVRVLRLGAARFSREEARRMAARLAQVLLHRPIAALGGHTLAGIQAWSGRDERVVARLGRLLASGDRVSRRLGAGAYAAHAVAAAAGAALAGGDPERLQARMIEVLAAMNRQEARWRG